MKNKILWIEDDKLISKILSQKFIDSDFDLINSKTAEEGLEILKTTTPDVIVLDIILPQMSGFEMLQRINSDPNLRNIPVVILSNTSNPSDISRAKQFGVKKFLVKAATSLDQIIAEVSEVCKK